MSQSIRGKVAIATGASSGIGRAIARLFAAEGAKLVLAARSIDKLDRLAGEIGGDPLTLSIDLEIQAKSIAWPPRRLPVSAGSMY